MVSPSASVQFSVYSEPVFSADVRHAIESPPNVLLVGIVHLKFVLRHVSTQEDVETSNIALVSHYLHEFFEDYNAHLLLTESSSLRQSEYAVYELFWASVRQAETPAVLSEQMLLSFAHNDSHVVVPFVSVVKK